MEETKLQPAPHLPRITKSTPVPTIRTYFPTEEALLERFDLAKNMANVWDGERDGLREAVKKITAGTWGRCVLTRKTTAAVCYPNADGKHQLENTLQTDIPEVHGLEVGSPIIVFHIGTPDGGSITPASFLDRILHELQKGKDQALSFVESHFVGSGRVIENASLYKKEDGEKTDLTILPNE